MTIIKMAHLSCATLALVSSILHAEDSSRTIIVTGQRAEDAPDTPASAASINAVTIRTTINAVNVEDSLKYLPSLLVRKRHIGDTQAPLATRTSGVGASARSLIYADGALLSALMGNNNSFASPRWGLVSPQEVARIDVLYGPFSAAYPGNSIGAVVNITTRLPDTLEATADAGVSVQRFSQYSSDQTLPSYQTGATLGDRIGRFGFFLSANHVDSRGQPLAFATAARPAATSAAGTPVTGAFADLNRLGQPIAVLGATGIEQDRQTMLKAKLALDLGTVRLAYVGGLFLNHVDATAETYLGGGTVYAGTLNIGGYAYTVPASAFSNNVYRFDERHWSHSLTAEGNGAAFDWRVIGTLYRYGNDEQRTPTGALPAASAGGAGNLVRLDGTGWATFDARGAWKTGDNTLSFGGHADRFTLNNQRYALTDWRNGQPGARNLASKGRTRTLALWAEDAWTIAAPLTLTIGARQEYWRAYNGYNYSAMPVLATNQPERRDNRFSPKATAAWAFAPAWTARASFGQAWRFPTVSELYQVVTTGPSLTVPDPNLRAERARSAKLAVEGHGLRVSLFDEHIRDALVSQTAPLLPGSTQLFSFVQNIGLTHARGVEAAFDRRDLLPGFDLATSLTYADGTTVRDPAFPAAEGKRLPQVPRWKASVVATWRPVPPVSLTGALRYASRQFATIDNSDSIGHTYQGFEDYLVADLRATFRASAHWTLGLGVDNGGNDKYFLFHPFPQRTFALDVHWQL
ncbi:TonB-dependent receptor [Sphingomonas antarctica]|uniref:TonB-dependent receptor n=1 Tax=Sphingomonas antarctica TaxID=2040274 RepID=UPI0039E7F311